MVTSGARYKMCFEFVSLAKLAQGEFTTPYLEKYSPAFAMIFEGSGFPFSVTTIRPPVGTRNILPGVVDEVP